MSATIDQKVVEMRFDNKQFESNVSTTMSTLEKFKKSLQFKGVEKGFENLNAASRKIDFSQSEIAACKSGFRIQDVWLKISSVFEYQIARRIVNSATQIAKALTIEPIMTGFSEYETKINAIQTIMSNTASKGTTMDDVTKTLDELNQYADKTIYNFAEMTRNIGTFTAAGVGLEESATAIQGIANLAAASGSSSQQASTAMYQLSQALASGTVKLMDWNSVVNAGMGGELFQNALKDTAKAHGVAVDEIIKKHGSFRESLSEGWITSEILTETLGKMTKTGAAEYLSKLTGVELEQIKTAQNLVNTNKDGTASYDELAKKLAATGKISKDEAINILKLADNAENAATQIKTFTQLWDTLKESAQSGWSKTWEILIGDFNEAKETLTKFSDIIGGMISSAAEARNELLQGWKDEGGRADLVESLFNAFEALMSVIKPIKEAFQEIFPPLTVKQLVMFTRGLKDLTANLKVGGETADKIKRTFRGLFAIFDIAIQLVQGLFKGIGVLTGALDGVGGGFLSVTATLGDWLVVLSETIRNGRVFEVVFKGIGIGIRYVIDAVRKLINPMNKVSLETEGMGDAIVSTFDKMSDAIANSGFVKLLKSLLKVTVTIVAVTFKLMESLAGMISDTIEKLDFDAIFGFINSISITGILAFIMKIAGSFSDLAGSFSEIKESAIGILNELKGVLSAFQQDIKANVIVKIAVAVGILVASIVVLSALDPEKVSSAVSAIMMLFGALIGATALFGKISGTVGKVAKATMAMITMSISVLILASALKKLSGMDFDEMMSGVLAIGLLLAELVVLSYMLPQSDSNFIKGSITIIAYATALYILSNAVATLAAVDAVSLIKGLLAVTVLMVGLTYSMKMMPSTPNIILTSIGMIGLATAITILSHSVALLGKLSWSQVAKGVLALAGSLLAIAVSMKLMPKIVSMKLAVSLLSLAAAMTVLTGSLYALGHLSWSQIAKGLAAIAGTMLSLALAMKLMPKRTTIQLTYTLLALSAAMVILTGVLYALAQLSWKEILKSLVTLAGALVILSVAMNTMKHAVLGAASILVISSALAVLTPILITLGSMEWESIAKGMVAIAGAFIVFGVAGTMLGKVAPVLLVVSASITLFGIGCMAAGVGLTMLSTGVSSLALSVGIISKALVTIIRDLITLIPELFVQIAEGINAFSLAILDAIPAIINALKTIILSLNQMLVDVAPSIIDTVLKIVVMLLEALIEYSPAIHDGLFTFLLSALDKLIEYGPQIIDKIQTFVFQVTIGAIKSLAKNIPDLIEALVELFMAVFKGSIDALKNIDPKEFILGLEAIGLITGIIAALAAIAGLIPPAFAGVIGMGVILAELAIVLGAIGAIAQLPGLSWLIEEGADIMKSIGNAIGGFIGGIIGGFAEGITSALPQIGTDLSNFMTNLQPFIEGAKAFDASILDGVYGLVGVIMALTAADVIDGLTTLLTGGLVGGGSSLAKFGEEIAAFGPHLKTFADSITGIDTAAVESAAKVAKTIAEMTHIIPNEGGIISWFTGENSIAKFGDELPKLGAGIKGFSDSVAGIVPENIEAAAIAAKAITDMANTIPNEGGVLSWFSGDNGIAKFGDDLPKLGDGLKGFSDTVAGIVPENIVAAASAAKALSDMANAIPNTGGLVTLLSGDNSLSMFSGELVSLGNGLKGFSDAVAGIVPENVAIAADAAASFADLAASLPDTGGLLQWIIGEKSISKFGGDLVSLGNGLKGFSDAVTGIVPENVTSAASAAKSLVDLTLALPHTGGVAQWFTGEQSLSKFGNDLINLGSGLKGFSDSVTGIVPENITSAAQAAKSVVELTKSLPDTGGVVQWFTGEQSLSKFGNDLINLGAGLKGFSDSVIGIVPENITSAAQAAKSLAELTTVLPNAEGVVHWFTGEQSLSKFGNELPALGSGLKAFSDSIAGVVPENITAAANAAVSLADLTNVVPRADGVEQWLSGENSIAKFGDELPALGAGIKAFSDSVNGINPENVSAGASAAKSIAEMASIIPNAGGIKQWFTGEQSLAKFADHFPELGNGLKAFSDSVSGIKSENVTAGANAAKELASMCNSISGDGSKLVSFGENVKAFGVSIKSYFLSIAGIASGAINTSTSAIESIKKLESVNTSKISGLASCIKDAADSIKSLSQLNHKTISLLTASLERLGEACTESFMNGLKDFSAKMKKVADDAIEAFEKAISGRGDSLKKTCMLIVSACTLGFKSAYDDFQSAGSYLVSGFANGISANTYRAKAKAKAMAAAAAQAARRELDEHSPSKVGYEIGDYFGIAFVNGIADNVRNAYDSSSEMASNAKRGLTEVVGKIRDAMDSDMDMQPTIKPVLDLSNVRAGASTINGMFGMRSSVGVLANVGSISASMNRQNQNGTNADVVSAINKLRKDLGNVGNTTYNVGGVTYDDGSNIADAVKSLVRAAKVERRI